LYFVQRIKQPVEPRLEVARPGLLLVQFIERVQVPEPHDASHPLQPSEILFRAVPIGGLYQLDKQLSQQTLLCAC
jgi:hypothetical protein